MHSRYPWFTAGGGSPNSSFETNEHDHHRLRRGALNPFFSKRSIINIEPIIWTQVSNLLSLLRNNMTNKSVVDLRVAYSSLTLDIISNYCFGASWGCLTNQELAEEWKYTLDDVFEKANLIMHFPWMLKLINLLPDSIAGPVIRHHRNTRKHVSAILRHDPATEKNTNTIFHELRDSDLPPSEKTMPRLADEGNILIGAGSETTAQVLAVLSFHLLDNPDILARLREELDAVMPTLDTEVKWSQLEQLPFLTAVLKEALRISSPVLTRLPRISPNEDLRYGSWTIPAGIPVSMSCYSLDNNPNIHPSPHKFDPQRWLKTQAEGMRLDKYFVPFAKGSRNCLGLNLAWAELYIAVAAVFRSFEMELYETSRKDVDVGRDGFVSMPIQGSKGVRVKILKERQ